MKNLIKTRRNIQNFFIKVFKFFFLWYHCFFNKKLFYSIKWALYTTGTDKRCGISCFPIIAFQYESKHYCKFIWLYCSNNPPILALLKSVLMSLEFFFKLRMLCKFSCNSFRRKYWIWCIHCTKNSFLRIWSYLLKKSLVENFIFCAVIIAGDISRNRYWRMPLKKVLRNF